MPRGRDPLLVSGVVGDVLDPFVAVTEFEVLYGGRTACINGCTLKPSQIIDPPRVQIGGEFRNFYTLIMVDADAPTPGCPYLREYLHWMVTNIPGTTGPRSGSEIVSYEAPEPTMGIHRVVLVVFRQPTGLPQSMNAPEWRHNFNIREFARRYNLGSPVAAVYYNCLRETGVGGRRA